MIRKIEELSMNAFPALSTLLLNGWILRFANGYSKRANSVNPIYPCSIEEETNICLCEQIYEKNGLDKVFKLTESEYCIRLDEMLADRGYIYEAKTNVMRMEITGFEVSEDEVTVYREPIEEWVDAFARINNISPENTMTLKKMLAVTIPDIYCACIYNQGEIVAVGLGVAEGEYIGMFDIYTSKELRRQGFGTKIMNSLMYHAARDGYKYAYLQVVDDNAPAKALYEKLGYKKQYSYWYRVKKDA